MLTAKQHQTYQFICDYIHTHGQAPTEAEIALGIGITSRGTVHRYVTAIADEGLIEIIPKKRRNIRLHEQTAMGELPILGKIAAGQPLEAIDPGSTLNIPAAILGPDRFILHVQGDSMIGDNICDGDYIICEKTTSVSAKDIAVVLVDNQEATLKRVRDKGNGMLELIPSNPTLQSMCYAKERVHIQGIYIGLIRL